MLITGKKPKPKNPSAVAVLKVHVTNWTIMDKSLNFIEFY